MLYSASIMELGEDAAKITWENALDCEIDFIDSEEKEKEARDYIREFGAWSEEEITSWSRKELNALIIQFISGDLREYLYSEETMDDEEFEEWRKNHGGSIYRDEERTLWFYMGY